MLITLTNIYAYVHDNPQCSKKSRPLDLGEQLYRGEHIVNCGLLGDNEVEARCITSQINAAPHRIQIKFEHLSDYKRWKCSCSCKAGAGEKCKHIVATLLYIYHATALEPLSCTDVDQKWGKRVQQRLVETVPLEDFCHVAAETNNNDINNSVDVVKIMLNAFEAVPESEAACHFYGVSKSVAARPEAKSPKDFIRNKTWEAICRHAQLSQFSQMLLNVEVEELKACCIITYNNLYPCDALEMCKVTAGNEGRWQEERQFRITGTRCYDLFTHAKDDWETKALKYFFPKSFAGNYATKYGQLQEKVAREIYRSHLEDYEEVIEFGLAICQANPWLACSPDGIILSNKQPDRLLEIKCPVIGSKKTITDCLPLLNYMKLTTDGFKLKRKHTYFAQVQLAMCILNLPVCDFILFSSYDNSIYLEKIPLDEQFCKILLTKLRKIFFNKMLHVLCDCNI